MIMTTDGTISGLDIQLDFGGSYFIPNTYFSTHESEVRMKEVPKFETTKIFSSFSPSEDEKFQLIQTGAKVSLLLNDLR